MPPDPLVLAFDTSAAHCAAALLSGTSVLAHRIESMEKGHADRLIGMLEEMLAESALSWRDLAVLGVGTGPGNFTGVRIAVAAARGLSLGSGIPAVGITALEALVYGSPGVRVALLDARRGGIYVQVFGDMQDGEPAVLCSLDTLPHLPKAPVCIGYNAAEVAALCGGRVTEPVFPQTVTMARIALRRVSLSGAARMPRPAPFYLRGADAAPPSDPPPLILP